MIDGLLLQAALDYVRQPDSAPGLAATTEKTATLAAPAPPPPALSVGKVAAASRLTTAPPSVPSRRPFPILWTNGWTAKRSRRKPETAVQQFMREDAPLTSTVTRSPTVRPKPLRRTHWRDGSGAEMRSQTYMEGLRAAS